MRYLFLFLLGTAILSSSCAGFKQKKWLANHRTALSALAKSDMNAEQKLDGLFATYVTLMDEGLKFTNPVKGAKYITKFQKENNDAIESILRDAEKWRTNLNIAQGIELGLRIPKKSYAKDFIALAPRFKRKYNQYKFIMDMTGKLAGGFGKVAEKVFSL
jgi:hypothetical protein